MRKKVLVIADAAVHTGFAQVTENLISRWDYDPYILAINYHGDHHWLQTKAHLYNPNAYNVQDVYGYTRVGELVNKVKPDFVFMINDPWVCMEYIKLLPDSIPTFAYIPIDSENVKEQYLTPLNKLTHIIAYTQFAKRELQRAVTIPIDVIYHGVDTDVFYPDTEARERAGVPNDWYIVNVTDRNTPRKRLDLALYYFAEWVKDKPNNIKLHYHGALEDQGWDLVQLSKYLGINERVIYTSKGIKPGYGIPTEGMRDVYNLADVGLSTSMAEGFSLPTIERMACRIPMIVPNHSAFSEWPTLLRNEAVYHTEVYPIPMFATNGLNTAQKVPTLESTVEALDSLYFSKDYRELVANNGYELSRQDYFNWDNIAQQFTRIFEKYI